MLRIMFTILFVFMSGAVTASSFVEKATPFKGLLSKEIADHFPNIPNKAYIPALISHETCPSAKHSKCWNPRTTFNTKRERGAGLGQLTLARRADGSTRFDSLTEMSTRYRDQLHELKWSNVLDRPDLQIRAIVLMVKREYNRFYDDGETPLDDLSFVDSAYNGGGGHVMKDIQLCKGVQGCDDARWFNNVDGVSVKSRKPLYAGRSAYRINREHVADVVLRKMPLFEDFFDEPTKVEIDVTPTIIDPANVTSSGDTEGDPDTSLDIPLIQLPSEPEADTPDICTSEGSDCYPINKDVIVFLPDLPVTDGVINISYNYDDDPLPEAGVNGPHYLPGMLKGGYFQHNDIITCEDTDKSIYLWTGGGESILSGYRCYSPSQYDIDPLPFLENDFDSFTVPIATSAPWIKYRVTTVDDFDVNTVLME